MLTFFQSSEMHTPLASTAQMQKYCRANECAGLGQGPNTATASDKDRTVLSAIQADRSKQSATIPQEL